MRAGQSGAGSFTLGQRTYQMLRGSATFVSPDVMVPPPGPPEEGFSIASSPFRYEGFFDGESGDGERVRVNLTGRGTASVFFDYSDGSASWFHRFTSSLIQLLSRSRHLCCYWLSVLPQA